MRAEFTRYPRIRRRDSVSPSGASLLLGCALRLGYNSEPDAGKRAGGSSAAWLGTICHEVLEAAARGGLPEADSPGWDTSIETVWQEAVQRQIEELEPSLGPQQPETWPYYARRKAATKRVARRVRAELSVPGVVAVAEEPLETADRTIRGRPDLVIRAPEHEVRDYKTGSLVDPQTGDTKKEYVTQLLLYAVLEHAATGKWPSKGRLVPLQGVEVEVPLGAERASAVEAEARSALDRYNEFAEAGGDPAGLASPAPANCRYCDHAPECPAFWESLHEGWREEGIQAVAGVVTEARVSARGTVSIDIERAEGVADDGLLTFASVDPSEFPQAAEAKAGDTVVAVGLRSRQAGIFETTASTRLNILALDEAGIAASGTRASGEPQAASSPRLAADGSEDSSS